MSIDVAVTYWDAIESWARGIVAELAATRPENYVAQSARSTDAAGTDRP